MQFLESGPIYASLNRKTTISLSIKILLVYVFCILNLLAHNFMHKELPKCQPVYATYKIALVMFNNITSARNLKLVFQIMK